MLLVLFAVLAVAHAELAPLMTDNEPIPGAYIVVLEVGTTSHNYCIVFLLIYILLYSNQRYDCYVRESYFLNFSM